MGRATDDAAATHPTGKVSRSLRSSVFTGEEIVMVARPGRLATLPKLLLTLGLYSFWRRVDTSTLTSHRILMGHGIIRRVEKSIPLANVDDVEYVRRGLNGYVELSIRDRGRQMTRRVGPLTPHAARRFTKETLRRS